MSAINLEILTCSHRAIYGESVHERAAAMIELTNLLFETKNPKPAICAINIKSMTAFLPDDRFYVVMDWLAAEYRAGNVLLTKR